MLDGKVRKKTEKRGFWNATHQRESLIFVINYLNSIDWFYLKT